MAKSRNQRQRKKLHLAEFQELGFFGELSIRRGHHYRNSG